MSKITRAELLAAARELLRLARMSSPGEGAGRFLQGGEQEDYND